MTRRKDAESNTSAARIRSGPDYHAMHSEERLVLAILEDAVKVYQRCAFTKREKDPVFRDAERWIMSGDRRWPFSFLNICDLLGLNPYGIRSRLQALFKCRMVQERATTNVTSPKRVSA